MTHDPDHDCRSIMSTAPFVLTPGFTVRESLKALIDNRVLGIPVVDKGGHYIGMFVKSRLIAACLPRVLGLEASMPAIARLIDAGYASDTMGDVRERFDAIADEPVEQHADADVPVMKAETPLTTALHFLHRTRNFLPVVDDDNRLIGVVSTWDVMARIAETD